MNGKNVHQFILRNYGILLLKTENIIPERIGNFSFPGKEFIQDVPILNNILDDKNSEPILNWMQIKIINQT